MFLQVLPSLLYAAALWVLYCVACLGIGGSFVRLMGISAKPGTECWSLGYVATGFAIGLGLLSTVWQALALMDILTGPWVAATLVVSALFFFRQQRNLMLVVGWNDARSAFHNASPVWRILAIVCLVVLAMLAPASLHPPGADAMAYYLAQAKLIGVTGRTVPLIGYEGLAETGFLAEMNYAAMFALGSEIAARMTMWAIVLANACLVWVITAELGGGFRARLLAASMLLSSSAFVLVAWDGKTDLVPTLFGLAMIWLLILTIRQERIGLAFLAGLAGGFAMVAKLSLIPVLGIVALVLLVGGLRNGAALMRMVPLVVLGGAVALLQLAVKNWIVFSEPFAPFLYLARDQSAFVLDQVWYDAPTTRWIVATYPLALLWGKYPMQHGNMSPLWLCLIPLVVLLTARDRAHHRLLLVATAAALAGIVGWIILKPSVLAPRYFLPAILLLFPIAAIAGESAAQRIPRIGVIAAITAIAFVSLVIINLWPVASNALKYTKATPERWPDAIWQAAAIVREKAKPGERLMLAAYYSSPFDAKMLTCLLKPDEKSAIFKAATPQESWASLYRAGGRFLFYYPLTHASHFTVPPNPLAAPEWLNVEEQNLGPFRLYILNPLPGAPASAVCSPQ